MCQASTWRKLTFVIRSGSGVAVLLQNLSLDIQSRLAPTCCGGSNTIHVHFLLQATNSLVFPDRGVRPFALRITAIQSVLADRARTMLKTLICTSN